MILSASQSRTRISALLVLTALLAIALLTQDNILWAVAIIKAYALILFVVIDLAIAGLVYKGNKMGFTLALGWSILRITMQVGDVATAGQYGFMPHDFADYLFNPTASHPSNPSNPQGVPGIFLDAILIFEILTAVLAFKARSSSKRPSVSLAIGARRSSLLAEPSYPAAKE